MRIQSLAGSWEFHQVGKEGWLPASVPGSVHTDLLALGLIPDPFVGDNEKHVQWVAESDWVYRHRFPCTQEILAEEHIFLVCDGLDTLATLALNGHTLGHTDNMFRRYEWEVKEFLEIKDENQLTITFSSPVKYITQKQSVREMPGPYHSIPGGPYLRKAPCQFGWDWSPKLPPLGIWKDIRLEGFSVAKFNEVLLKQIHSTEKVILEAHIAIERWGAEPLICRVSIIAPNGERTADQAAVTNLDQAIIKLPISNPELWWPNGYGGQPLYQVEVILRQDDISKEMLLDQQCFQIGLRTLQLRQAEDPWGRSFSFIVNDVPIMAKGSNWIPADSFPTRITQERIEFLIRSAAQTHHNMLRVWGGGIYEDERFYDLCDRYGILIWQEFIFSCSIYPLDNPEFIENVHQEVSENIQRLRHRACLVLWCGNNEMEEGWLEWNWDCPDLQDLKAAYNIFFHHTLPEWCQADDPEHAYWPSSPSSDTPFIDPNGQQQGDCHYWDVWHKGKPFTDYRQQYPRFMSEFGFQALPPLATIRTYAEESDWNMTSYIMEQHQKNANGNSLIVRQMLDTFLFPKDFSSLVYLSMVLQAEGIRYGVEHWRRHPERVAGILYWQLNDCWPVASWSSLDYFGRWKALHYVARRFYTPVLLSIEDNPPEMSVYVTNDLLQPWEGKVTWSLESLAGETVVSGLSRVKVAAQAATQVCKQDFSDYVSDVNLDRLVFIAELWQNDQLISRQVAFFTPIKHLALTNPAIKVTLERQDTKLIISLTSRSMALLVEVSLADMDVLFSDNYFSLPAGREVRISCPLPAGWTESQASKALQVRTVYDSYAHSA